MNNSYPIFTTYTPLNRHSNFNIKKKKVSNIDLQYKKQKILKILLKFVASLQNYQFMNK